MNDQSETPGPAPERGGSGNEKPKKREKARRGNGEGSIFQRTRPDGKPGLWAGTISLGHGSNGKRRRRTVYGTTKREVQEQLAKLQTQKATGDIIEPSKMTVEEYLQTWLKDTARLRVRATTLASYTGMINREVIPRIGKLKLAKLTKLHVKRLYGEMEEAGKSARLRQMVHTVLRKALGDAVEDDILPANPASSRKLRPKAPKPEMKFLDESQARAFLDSAAGDRLEALYVLALLVGLRQGELFALGWPDIDLTTGRISVRRTLIELNGRLSIGEPKSAKGRRQIQIPEAAVRALEDHRKRMLIEGNSGSEFVFCSPDGKRLRKSNLLRRSFRPILEKANEKIRDEAAKSGGSPVLLPNIRFHDLRHSNATALLKQGVHPKVVQERLGHSQISLTLDTYSHVVQSMDQDAAAKLDAMFPRKKAEPPSAAAGA